jgi:hypothetical protein
MSTLLAASVSETGVPNVESINNYVPVVGTRETTLTDTWNRLTNAGTGVINILLWTAGIILTLSVIMHAISYISSGGDSSKAATARQGLVNAALGLIVVTLTLVITQAIVAFVR